MAQWILKANGNVAPRCTLRPLNTEEPHGEIEIKKCRTFNALIKRRWGTSIKTPKATEKNSDDDKSEEHDDNVEQLRTAPDTEDTVDANGKLLNQQPACNLSLNAEVQMNLGD